MQWEPISTWQSVPINSVVFAASPGKFSVDRNIDSFSPQMFTYAAKGTSLHEVDIDLFATPTSSGPFEIVRYFQVIVTGVSIDSASDVPSETVDFSATRQEIQAVPEPASLTLLASGLAAFAYRRRRKA